MAWEFPKIPIEPKAEAVDIIQFDEPAFNVFFDVTGRH